jgi:hypothetical protein
MPVPIPISIHKLALSSSSLKKREAIRVSESRMTIRYVRTNQQFSRKIQKITGYEKLDFYEIKLEISSISDEVLKWSLEKYKRTRKAQNSIRKTLRESLL